MKQEHAQNREEMEKQRRRKAKPQSVFFGVLFLLLVTGLWGCSADSKGSGKSKERYQATYLDLFDTVTTVIGYSESSEEFQLQAEQIYEELKYYHQLFDIYQEYDIHNLKTINDHAGREAIKVETEILELLSDCIEYYEQTNGKVNVAMGSVLSLWQQARVKALEDPDAAAVPSASALQEAGRHRDISGLILDWQNSTVYLTDPEQSLDVGAVAKGWAAQKVCSKAPEGFLISIGGNVCVTGKKPDGTLWIVGVQAPEEGSTEYIQTLQIEKGSVVTSGDYQRYFEADGKRYHHLIDPETGYPAERWKSVTILCEDSGWADALSTALFLLSKEEGEVLLKKHNASAIWVDQEGKLWQSEPLAENPTKAEEKSMQQAYSALAIENRIVLN